MWQMWKSVETLWRMLCCLQHHPAWLVWQWVSDGLRRHRLPYVSRRYPDCCRGQTLCFVLGPGFLLWPTKASMPLTGPHVPRTWIQLQPLGYYIYIGVHPNITTDCPGAAFCSNPGLGGESPGYHLLSHLTVMSFLHIAVEIFNLSIFSVMCDLGVPLISFKQWFKKRLRDINI